jgi:Uma2 family endonuclease
MPVPSFRRQRTCLNVVDLFRAFERKARTVVSICAPFDILIRKQPLQSRQPGVILISLERLQKSPGFTEGRPVEAPPELVVEVLSSSETSADLAAKLDDYASIGTAECWVLDPQANTAIQYVLTDGTWVVVAGPTSSGRLNSSAFPGLTARVADLFLD